MARPRNFDAEVVLDAARDLFWRRGYQATSLDDLTRITGVNKPSLSAAFGSKEDLFRLVLDRYHAMVLARYRRVLTKEGSARRAIRAWLVSFLSVCSGELGARGCLSVNTNLESALLNPIIRISVDQFQKDTMALLRAEFTRGKALGEFPANFDEESAARALLVAQMGLMILGRGCPPAGDTLAAMERLLNSIAPEPAS